MNTRRPDPDENDDFEVVEDPPPRPRKKKPRVVEDDEEEPIRARVRPVADDEDEPVRVPKRKKKKKKRSAADEPAEEPGANEWIIPLVLMGLGLVLTVIGTIGYARHPDFQLSVGTTIAFRLIGQVIAIPITVVALIGIGTVMGIEYGTLTSTVRNLAALGLLVGGLLDLCDWFRLPWFIYQPIIFVVGLGLLMSLFGLDVDEAMATMVGLNLLSFLLKVALFMVVMMIVHKEVNKGGFRVPPDDAPPPGWVEPGGDDGDDGDDAPPPPPKKRKR